MALSILLTLTLFLLPHGNIFSCSSSLFQFHFSLLVFFFIFQLRAKMLSSLKTVTPSPPYSTATSLTYSLTSSFNDPFLPISSFSILSTALSTPRNSPLPKVLSLPFLSSGGAKVSIFSLILVVILRYSVAEIVFTRLSGDGSVGYLDGDVGSARFDKPRSFAFDLRGNVYVADKNNRAIRKISAKGML